MVAMARALMGRPRVICMDEPTMGLSPLFVDRVLELIQTVNQQGVTIFMVEQNAHLALQIADYGYVLQTGRIVLSGPARDLLHDPRIRDAYLGGAAGGVVAFQLRSDSGTKNGVPASSGSLYASTLRRM